MWGTRRLSSCFNLLLQTKEFLGENFIELEATRKTFSVIVKDHDIKYIEVSANQTFDKNYYWFLSLKNCW